MPATPLQDLHGAVQRHFAARPTLRQVLSERLLHVLGQALPWVADIHPPLPSAQPLTLDSPVPGTAYWSTQPLLDYLLQALSNGAPLDLEPLEGRTCNLGVSAPHLLPGAQSSLATRALHGLTAALQAMLGRLPLDFQQAQLDYWRAQGVAGVSRERWMQLALKLALLRNLGLQRLDAQQRACVLGLLEGGTQQPAVYALQVHLHDGERQHVVYPAHLLISAEWDERQVLLWCAPSGVISAFDSLDAFALALREQMAAEHVFDTLVWDRYQLQGNVFALQCTLLLDQMLVRCVAPRPAAGGAALEQLFEALSDPAQFFIAGLGEFDPELPAPPPGLVKASAADSFAVQSALLQLAVDQLQSAGLSWREGIDDLHTFTGKQLRRQLLADGLFGASQAPEELLLELAIARGAPGGAAAGSGGGEPLERAGRMSLTEFAIGNLAALGGAFIRRVTQRNGEPVDARLSAAYLEQLVEQVDIGGRYPRYLAEALAERTRRGERTQRFAREWRQALLFSVLQARLDGRVSEVGLQCAQDYCAGHVDAGTPAAVLIPLAFRRRANAGAADLVQGAYVLFSAEPGRVLLYRPLQAAPVVLEFASLEAMLARIRSDQALQQQLLPWMSEGARAIYAEGGFAEPHVLSVGLDPYAPLAKPAPAGLATSLWLQQVDEKLYQANCALLEELAELRTTSTAQSRWQRLLQGAWLLFDSVTLLIRGPVASVAWLVQLIAGMPQRVEAIAKGSAFERSAAVVDSVLALGMALLHAPLRQLPAPAQAARPALRPAPPSRALVAPAQGKVGVLGQGRGRQLDFSWRGQQGFNVLAPAMREAVRALRSPVSLAGSALHTEGAEQGVYRIGARRYVAMAGDVYAVEADAAGLRIVGRQGEPGPWVVRQHGAWRVDARLRLQGGMPKSRIERKREQNRAEFAALSKRESQLIIELNAMGKEFDRHRQFLLNASADLEQVLADPHADAARQTLLSKVKEQARLRLVADLKKLIAQGLAHDDVVSQIHAMPLHEVAPTLARAIRLQRNATRRELIERCEIYYNELAQLINDADLDTLGAEMAVLPEAPAERQVYTDLSEKLEAVLGWEQDLVELGRRYDRLLEDTLNDDSIGFRDQHGDKTKAVWLKEIIEQRRVSAIDVEFRLLSDLAEASLDRLAPVDERTLVEYADYLNGEELRSAGSAHGDLAGSELSLDERVEILKGVLEAYSQARVMSDYLASLGGEAIRQGRLRDYRRVLVNLQDSAERELAQLVREQELAEPSLPRPRVYASRGGRRRVVTTRRGHSVVGVEREVDGEAVVEQLDYRATVLKTFRQQGGAWVEVQAQAEPAPTSPSPEPGVSARRARKLVDEIGDILRLARRYVESDEPHGLATVIDGHVEKLERTLAQLHRGPENLTLGEELSEGIARLRASRRDLLTALHFSTSHPTAESLRFLAALGKVSISRSGARRRLGEHDFLEVYEVRRQPEPGQSRGEGLWEAHFHYRSADAPRRDFAKGHLKLWAERKLGRDAQLRAAIERNELLPIYRGNLSLAQVEGLIPFE